MYRRVVGHFIHSTLAFSQLYEIRECLGLPKHKLQLDIKTRWNSSFYMVQSVLEQKMALAAYAAYNDINMLTPYKLDLANKIVEAL